MIILDKCARCNRIIWWWQKRVMANNNNNWKQNDTHGWNIHKNCSLYTSNKSEVKNG